MSRIMQNNSVCFNPIISEIVNNNKDRGIIFNAVEMHFKNFCLFLFMFSDLYIN